jgi:biotin carboxyl carrier protein
MAASLPRFISERVAPISRAFAATPLTELRVSTPEGSIRLVKSADGVTAARPHSPTVKMPHRAPKPLLTSDETGRPYDVISAEVVGIFSSAPDLPAEGERLEGDRVLGSVEALKLKHPVRSGGACTFIAQVAEEGQAVDFGEALFVVDRGEKQAPKAPEPARAEEPPELLEPPRL